MSWELTMRDFAVVTYCVEPDRVADILPHGFEAERFTLDSGKRAAFVSAVSFRVESIAIGGVTVPLNWVQVNYRAYVRRHETRCVWFFGSALSSVIAAIPRLALGLPWYPAHETLDAAWEDGRCARYVLDVQGEWGDADFECTSSGALAGRLDGFADEDESLAVLTSPFSGYCARPDGALLELRVKHAPLTPQLGEVRVARFPVFDDLNLCSVGEMPHSILLVERTTFEVLATHFPR